MGKMAGIGRADIHNDYLVGLDHLRKVIETIELDLDQVKHDFYEYAGSDEELICARYFAELNAKFKYCTTALRKAKAGTEVIDSENRLVELLNKMQELDDEGLDDSVITELTVFWEQIKDTLHRLKTVNYKFQCSIMKRLESTCSSYQNTGGTHLNFPAKYSKEVTKYQTEITDGISKIDSLVRSFPTGIRQELFTMTSFCRRVLAKSDHKTFPILRIVPDISEKFMQMCRLARQWIDKDETYVHDISYQIREQRRNARKKEKELKIQKEKHSKLSKAVVECHHDVKTYHKRLVKLKEDLQSIEFQLRSIIHTKKYKEEEIREKEGIVCFLDISITQTKKNCSLQLKKSRIMKQLKQLMETLKEIENDIRMMEDDVKMKYKEKEVVEEKVEETSRSYNKLKDDFDNFTEDIDKVQQEMNEMASSLQHLEIIQTFKTRPEKVDDFYDKPQSVKLAPSLKEKIQRRRALLTNSVGGQANSQSEPSGFFLTE